MFAAYGLEKGSEKIQSLAPEDLASWLSREGTAVWVDLEGEDVRRVQELAEPLRLHSLSVEEALEQRKFAHAKVDDFESYLFIVLHSARWDAAMAAPVLRELDIFLSEHWLITVHQEPTRAVTAARELCGRRPELLRRGTSFLLYHLLDTMVDNFTPVLQEIDSRLDRAETEVFKNARPAVLDKIFALKRGILKFRRVVGPERDTILSLTRDEFEQVPAPVRPYFRDVYDRLARVTDLLDSYRDEMATLLDIYLSIVSNRLNETMKALTVIATVLMTLSLVVGYYGMNFKLAEYNWPHGETFVLVLLVAAGLGVWWWMRGKKIL